MQRHFWFGGIVLASAIGLVAGCSGLSSRGVAARRSASPSQIAPEPASGGAAGKIAAAHAHYAAAIIHEMNDEAEAALRDYEEAALGDPDNEPLALEVSHRLVQAKMPEKAEAVLGAAAGRPGASGAVFARLALVYAQLGKTSQANAANRMAVKRSPLLLAGYQNLFFGYAQNKQEHEALKVLDDAAKQADADAEFLVGLGDLYGNAILQFPTQKANLKPKALAVYDRAEKLKPTSPLLRMRLADGYNLLGESDKAAEFYLELLTRLPNLPAMQDRVHAKLADIYLRSSDHKRASEQLEAVTRNDPTNPMAYYYLGSLAYDDKRPADAVEYFRKTVLLRPDFEQAYYDLALAQLGMDKPSDALATLETARAKFPQSFVLEFWTGLALSQQKSYAEALAHYTAAEVIAKATNPKQLTQAFYFQVGAACERKGDYAEAEKYFQQCLKLAPDFADAQNYLGYMWAEHGMKLDQAHDLIEKAVKSEPKNAAFLDSLGWVLYKLNRPKEALGYLLKAVELEHEPDPTVLDHLGDVYAALSQPGKAQEAWRKSLALEPAEAVRKKLGPEDKTPTPQSEIQNKSE